MATITINVGGPDAENVDEVAEYVEHLAEQIRNGHTSGIIDADRNWDSSDLPE